MMVSILFQESREILLVSVSISKPYNLIGDNDDVSVNVGSNKGNFCMHICAIYFYAYMEIRAKLSMQNGKDLLVKSLLGWTNH